MTQTKTVEMVHPLGEGDFSFATPGGRVRLSVTDDALTPFGGLVPWAAYTKHIGIVEHLAADCPVKRTSPNAAPVYDVIQSFMSTALIDGRRFSHIERMREDPTIPELFGMESVVGDDTVRRFFKSVDPVLGAEWIARHAKPMWGALPDSIVLDWDSTVQPKYGLRKVQRSATIRANRVAGVFILCSPSWRAPGSARFTGSVPATP